uniref:Uncharacterized protein LOC102808272 n=1 Tax=Saccoglossus kowalevskii TaxID=10224 RepID=A0ABM0MEY8_SACKO|nr:PREDICTED: uncharacterized protein LOC102808272 [Saccoglossus kowalevskii]
MRTNMQEVWTAGDTREGITSLVNYPEFFPAYDAIKRHGFNAISGAEWAQDIEAILNRFLNVDRHRDIRVLSIGSGNGNVDEPVIDTLAKMTTGKVLYCAIDPTARTCKSSENWLSQDRTIGKT